MTILASEFIHELLFLTTGMLICTTIHEFGHAFAADRLGDNTARMKGRLSLNPLRHLDTMGMLCILFFGYGWARPVPFNPKKLRHRQLDTALSAAAGPLANLLTALICAFTLGIFDAKNIVGFSHDMVTHIAILSCNLFLFNLIPLAPLDGSKVLFCWLPAKCYRVIIKDNTITRLILACLLIFHILQNQLTEGTAWILRHINFMCLISYKFVA